MRIDHIRKSIKNLEILINGRSYKNDPVILAMLDLFKMINKEMEKLKESKERLTWRDVFDSRKAFPAHYDKCLEFAKSGGYKYLAFNGSVYSVDQKFPDYDKYICKIEDLE